MQKELYSFMHSSQKFFIYCLLLVLVCISFSSSANRCGTNIWYKCGTTKTTKKVTNIFKMCAQSCMHAITKVVLHTTTRKLCMSIMDYLVYGKIGPVYFISTPTGKTRHVMYYYAAHALEMRKTTRWRLIYTCVPQAQRHTIFRVNTKAYNSK